MIVYLVVLIIKKNIYGAFNSPLATFVKLSKFHHLSKVVQIHDHQFGDRNLGMSNFSSVTRCHVGNTFALHAAVQVTDNQELCHVLPLRGRIFIYGGNRNGWTVSFACSHSPRWRPLYASIRMY
jgi:hypothetical protein